jgi:arylamine N-acetyltransferase
VLDVDGYLNRLGVAHPGPPSLASLFAIQRAHVDVVPYESLDIQLGRPSSLDALEAAQRIIAGRGGYCFHNNGALALLLDTLGYEVTRHYGGVFSREEPDTISGGHLALTVRIDGEAWLVDAGLGDGIYEPVLLRPGPVTQGPFTYRMQPSPLAPGGWRFWHDPRAGSFTGMDFAPEPVTVDVFAAKHAEFCTDPASNFVTVAQAGRRTAAGTLFLAGCVFRECDADGLRTHVVTSADEWFALVADVFGMPLADVAAEQREQIWAGLWERHQRWATSLNAQI